MTKVVGEEVLVYDLERHRAHSLNRVAAALWRACDGTRAEGEITARLHDEEAIPVTPELVRYGLGELGRARLVSESGSAGRLSRRDLVRRLGAAAVAIPLVTSIVAPTAAQAQSCTPVGGACTSLVQCCQGLFCSGGTPSTCCRGEGQSCTQDSDCCNVPLLSCAAGTCVP